MYSFTLSHIRLHASYCFMLICALLMSLVAPTHPTSAAAPAYLVKDIQTTPTTNGASLAQGTYAIGDTVYFFAFDPDHGVELWKSDGTDSGTMLVKDINPGWGLALHDTFSGIESPQFTSIGDTLFFVVDDGSYGHEVWRSDGTEQGTNIVKDAYPGASGSNPTELTSVDGTLFFVADDGVHGTELWRSDGTAQGTTIVKDMSPGIEGSVDFNLTSVGNEIFFGSFVFNSETSGHLAVWKSDGTEVGTVKVHVLSYPCYPNYLYQTFTNALTNVQGRLFFVNCTDYNGKRELWQSDGTDSGTSKITDLLGNENEINELRPVGDTLFFRDHDQLWKSDGTAAGTVLVKAVKPSNLTSVNGTLFFAGDDGVNGNELWRSDGSEVGTVLVKDINPGTSASNPITITPFHEGLVFAADDGTHGYELWRSDGSENGTVLVQDIYAGSTGAFYSGSVRYPWAVTANGTLFFPPNNAIVGLELWRSDGTAEGTRLVKDIVKSQTYQDGFDRLDVNGVLFFAATGDGTGQELWRSDGTEQGTFLLKDIVPGTKGSSPSNLTYVNGTLFFTASNGVFGRDLWRSDGTEAGTRMVTDLTSGSESYNISSLVSMSGTVFFIATISGQGTSLWRSDGTGAGTFKLKDTGFAYLTMTNDELIFITHTNGWQLWKSDGTSDGTVVVKSVDTHSHFNFSPQFAFVNGILYFIVNNDPISDGSSDAWSTYELWRSDGTDSGTIPLKSFDASPADYGVLGSIQAMGNKVYFVGSDADHGSELWSSDGTLTGTQLVADIYPGNGNSTPMGLLNVNNTLFFTALTPEAGRELWRSDGTAAGTSLVKDIAPGISGSTFAHFTQANGELFFAANDGISGTELWRSDGNSTGTTLVQDIAPGGDSSDPSDVTLSNGRLFFSADDQVHGYELWALRLADLPPPPATSTPSPSPTSTSTATATPTDRATATSTTTATTVVTATPSSTPEAPIASLRNHVYIPDVIH